MRVSSVLPLFFLLFSLTGLAQETVILTLTDPNPEEEAIGPTISPTLLYPGENVITLSSEVGIRRVTVEKDPAEAALYEVRKTGKLSECPTSTTIEFSLHTASRIIRPVIVVEKCDGSTSDRITLELNTVWNLDEVPFPDALAGAEVCRPFQVRLDGIGIGQGPETILDSVTSPVPGVSFLFTTPLPVEIPRGTTYRYNVCFSADKPGIYRIPVITWIRRDQPAGGHTTYPVADTGVVRVLQQGKSIILQEIEFSEADTAEGRSEPVIVDPAIADSLTIRGVDSTTTPGRIGNLRYSSTSATIETPTLTTVRVITTEEMLRKQE